MKAFTMRWICIAAYLLLGVGVVDALDLQIGDISPKGTQEGFVSLFDGKTLDGWQGDVKHYAVENGVLVCRGAKISTEKQYANFILRFEFKLPPGGNNGIGIRAPLDGDPAYAGMEIQIIDDDFYKTILRPDQLHGSIYGVAPAKSGSLKPAGQWNTEEILAQGSRIKVTVNGTVVTDVDLSKIDKPIDGRPHPGLHNAKGYISILGHDSPVAFRNLRIKKLQ